MLSGSRNHLSTLLIWIACLWFEEPEVKLTPEMQQLMRAEPA